MRSPWRWLVVTGTALSIPLFIVVGLMMIFLDRGDGGAFLPTGNRELIITVDQYKVELGYYHVRSIIDVGPLESATPAEMEEPMSVHEGRTSLPLPRSAAFPAIRYLDDPPADYFPTGRNVHVFIVGPQVTLPYWFILLLAAILPVRAMWRWKFA